MKRALMSSFFLLLSSPGIVAGELTPHCIRVQATSAQAFPLSKTYIGHLVGINDMSHRCYGTLVSPDGHVLTAAHCVVSNFTDLASQPRNDLHLCMSNNDDLQLQVLWIDREFDYAILRSSNSAATSHGWVAFSNDQPREDVELLRAGRGTYCRTVVPTDDFHLILDSSGGCVVHEGDSGEVVLSHDQIAGLLLSTGFKRSTAVTSSMIFLSVGGALGARRPILGANFPDTVAQGSRVEFYVEAMRTSVTGDVHIFTDTPGMANPKCLDSSPSPGHFLKVCQADAPRSAGPFALQFRATSDWGDSSHQVGEPWGSEDRDKEGRSVLTVHAEALNPKDPVWTGPALPYVEVKESRAIYSAFLKGQANWPEGQLRPPLVLEAYFNWGTSLYSGRVPAQEFFRASIANLPCGTLHHYQAEALLQYENGTSKWEKGKDRTFETLPCPLKPIKWGEFSIKAKCIKAVVLWVGRISCDDNPLSKCSPASLFFTYGPCRTEQCSMEPFTSSSTTVAGSSNSGDSYFSYVTISNLACNTKYHLRLNARTIYGLVSPIDRAHPEQKEIEFTLDCRLPQSFQCPDYR